MSHAGSLGCHELPDRETRRFQEKQKMTRCSGSETLPPDPREVIKPKPGRGPYKIPIVLEVRTARIKTSGIVGKGAPYRAEK